MRYILEFSNLTSFSKKKCKLSHKEHNNHKQLKMITIKVDEKTEFQVEERDGEIIIDKKTTMSEFAEIKPGRFHIIHNHRSYEAEIMEMDQNRHAMTLKINDQEYQISIEDSLDKTIKSLGLRERNIPILPNVCAPMPGFIHEVVVKEGDQVKKDQVLLVLKAMKMENIIYSSREGVITNIPVKQGESVEKGQILIQF